MYKFKKRPVDPSDPFIGKYFRLNYDIISATSNHSTWSNYESVYITLKMESLGFSMVKTVSRDLSANCDYVEAKVNWYNEFDRKINFSFPFNEFYKNESKAYDAEVAHVKALQDS